MRRILAVFLLFVNVVLVIINSSSKNALNDFKKEKMYFLFLIRNMLEVKLVFNSTEVYLKLLKL